MKECVKMVKRDTEQRQLDTDNGAVETVKSTATVRRVGSFNRDILRVLSVESGRIAASV